MEHTRKGGIQTPIDPEKAEEVQSILEKLVTHLLVKKPDEPVRLYMNIHCKGTSHALIFGRPERNWATPIDYG